MLALAGFITMVAIVALIISKRVSVTVALCLVPIVAGILVGEVEEVEKEAEGTTAPIAQIVPAANASLVRELFILTNQDKQEKK